MVKFVVVIMLSNRKDMDKILNSVGIPKFLHWILVILRESGLEFQQRSEFYPDQYELMMDMG